MAKYLVTGGCGFLGSRLIGELMSNGHKVLVLENLSRGIHLSATECIELNIGDVCDHTTVLDYMKGVDGCFHLSELADRYSNSVGFCDIKTNLVAAFNVLSVAAHLGVKVVYSASELNCLKSICKPMREIERLDRLALYSADSSILEINSYVFSLLNSFPNIGINFCNLYGEQYSHEPMMLDEITRFVSAILKQKSIRIEGDGSQVNHYIHVADAVQFLVSAMQYECHCPEVYNIFSGEGIKVSSLARRLMLLANSQVPIECVDRHSKSFDLLIEGAIQAENKLGFRCNINLDAGLLSLIEFYRRYPNYLPQFRNDVRQDEAVSSNNRNFLRSE